MYYVLQNIQIVLKKIKKKRVYFNFFKEIANFYHYRGRVGVGLSLPEPTYLNLCQNTYRHLPTGRSRSGPYYLYNVIVYLQVQSSVMHQVQL